MDFIFSPFPEGKGKDILIILSNFFSALIPHSAFYFINSIFPGRQVWSNQGSSGP